MYHPKIRAANEASLSSGSVMRTYPKILAFLGTVLGTIALLPAAAQASPVPLGHCGSNLICFWSGTNFSGTKVQLGTVVGGPASCSGNGLGVQAKSIENNSGHPYKVFSDNNCVTKVGDIFTYTANNNTSSPSWKSFKGY
jgi:hypothetical protein